MGWRWELGSLDWWFEFLVQECVKDSFSTIGFFFNLIIVFSMFSWLYFDNWVFLKRIYIFCLEVSKCYLFVIFPGTGSLSTYFWENNCCGKFSFQNFNSPQLIKEDELACKSQIFSNNHVYKHFLLCLNSKIHTQTEFRNMF